MKIGILKELENENRVALIPSEVATLTKMKVNVMVESGAGDLAFISDAAYKEAGAETTDRASLIQNVDLVIGINVPPQDDIQKLKAGQVLMAILQPLSNQELVQQLQDLNVSSFSLDIIPRTTRAQSMDILSSMATVAGYKAVLASAMHLPKFFPMFMTAAGSIKPAKLLVLGAGVAGLQTIATARKLGAVVEAFDVRAAAKEEVLSLGAKFVEVEGARDEASAGGYAVEQSDEFKSKQQQLVQEHAERSDVVITTAQIPGKKAPVLITKETVEKMKPGSVIVDLAASTGGNCEVTENNKTIEHNGVTIIGDSDLASTLPSDASKMFSKNVMNLLQLMIKEGELNLDFEDDIVKGTCVTHNKELVNERIKELLTPTT